MPATVSDRIKWAEETARILHDFGEDGHLISARDMFERLSNLTRRDHDEERLSEIWFNCAFGLLTDFLSGDHEAEATELFLQMEEKLEHCITIKNCREDWFRAMVNMVASACEKGQISTASLYTEKAFIRARDIKDHPQLMTHWAKATGNLLISAAERQDHAAAEKYCFQVISAWIESPDNTGLIAVMLKNIVLYYKLSLRPHNQSISSVIDFMQGKIKEFPEKEKTIHSLILQLEAHYIEKVE